ncbi:alginate export family protein [Croceicoccus sp. F390]|uniref:Alginate export family protein n=1 Tax=Croceicoccus esteveae TaxID=3075597 RepID=A0ABU2ZHG4_9SPHN|nr:alginate export family protein [Croceicoccus sp. F390]MDT0576043.1 alginate export family protein [Croceicoccus sp. F390]
MDRVAVLLAGFTALALPHQSAVAQAAPAGASSAAKRAGALPDWIDVALDTRYRYEYVEQDDFDLDAHASTLRLRFGAKVDPIDKVSLHVEGETIVHLGPDKFNDTANNVMNRPIVADPEDVLLNQAYVRFKPHLGLEVTAGRQTINYDNQRWVGSVGWRQNDQTLDAVAGSVEKVGNTGISANYAYAWRVNRVFGPDSPQGIWRDNDIHLLRIAKDIGELGSLVTYGYWFDIPEAPPLSNRTFGARFTGRHGVAGGLSAVYALEFARQFDAGRNPVSDSHDYLLMEPGFGFGPASVRFGYERLGGNGASALQTPLATLHAFNGWADKFLVTPPTGLRDLYLDAAYQVEERRGFLSATTFRVVYHDFRSTTDDLHYGREWNALVSRRLFGSVSLTLKLAHYDAVDFAADTTKGWVQIDARY